MTWSPNSTILCDILILLRQADSTDSQIQRGLAEAVGRLELLIDAPCYYVYILTECQQEAVEVRQRAGLLLKTRLPQLILKVHTSLSTNEKTSLNSEHIHEAEVLGYVEDNVSKAILDKNREIRATGGTIITTLIARRSREDMPKLLPFLLQLLDHENGDIVDATFDTFVKILEDEADRGHLIPSSYTEKKNNELSVSPFYEFCGRQLIPRLFQIAQSDLTPLQQRCKALICLNNFARGQMFHSKGVFSRYFSSYWETLGLLANVKSDDVRYLILSGLAQLSVIDPDFVTQNLDSLMLFICDCLDVSTQTYEVRLECLELLSILFKRKQSYSAIGSQLEKLLPVFVENTRYSVWDYMQMDPNQFVDDNALTPDAAEDIAPVFRGARRHEESMYATEGSGETFDNKLNGMFNDSGIQTTSTWGSRWTVRKVAAMLLDHSATIFGVPVLSHILPIIETKLQSEEWEVKESALLTLGAIARGTIEGLDPLLPRIIDILIPLCNHKRPILRTISLWSLSRFSIWICPQPDVLSLTCRILLSHVLDTNKRVQEAACSAFASLAEDAGESLIPHLSIIIQTFSAALQSFQTRNKFVLLDAIATVSDSLQHHVDTPEFHACILSPLVSKWNTTEKTDPMLILLFECINCIIHAIRQGVQNYTPVLVERCLFFIRDVMTRLEETAYSGGSSEHQILDRSDREVVECSFDLLSKLSEADPTNVKRLLSSTDIMDYLRKYCQISMNVVGVSVKQGCFALIGDLAEKSTELLIPHLNVLIPELIPYITETITSVSHNASWALGQIAMHAAKDGQFNPFAQTAAANLATVLVSRDCYESLIRISCITLGRIALICPVEVNKEAGKLFGYWCFVMTASVNDNDKTNAVRGMCNIIQHNESLAIEHMSPLCEMIASLYTINTPENDAEKQPAFEVPKETHDVLVNLLSWLQTSYGKEWETAFVRLNASAQTTLSKLCAH